MNDSISARLRKAEGSELLPKVLLGMHNAERTCIEAADHIDAQDAKIAALVEALEGMENARNALCSTRSRETYIRMIDHDKATEQLDAMDRASARARAALAAAKETT